jgi:hypothetical protein
VRGLRGGGEEGGGVRSGSGAARTILHFHTISARPSKQSHVVGITLGAYRFGLISVSARTDKRHHHHQVVHTSHKLAQLHNGGVSLSPWV